MYFRRQPHIVTLQVGETLLSRGKEQALAAEDGPFTAAAQETAVGPMFGLSLQVKSDHCCKYG